MRILKRLAAGAAVITAALGLTTVPAGASDHLSHAANNPGVAQRDFDSPNPVLGNPSDTSQNHAQPQCVPGEGDPNHGMDRGTPSVNHDACG